MGQVPHKVDSFGDMDIVVDILVEEDMVLIDNYLVEYILEAGNSLEYNFGLDLCKVGLDIDLDNFDPGLDKDNLDPDLDLDNSEVDIDY